MSTRRLCAALLSLTTFLTQTSVVYGGDREAHTNAIYEANANVKRSIAEEYGLGGPRVQGAAVYPPDGLLFSLPGPHAGCEFAADRGETSSNSALCAFMTPEGRAINEPDFWHCSDPRQPPAMVVANEMLAPEQTRIARLIGGGVSQLAMLCNWNHFVSNPALEPGPNRDAQSAFRTTLNWAEEIPNSLVNFGATMETSCNQATWERYLARSYNALHFKQDAQCEHHGEGNVLCGADSVNPLFASNPIYSFVEANVCRGWLLLPALGTSRFSCDEAVALPIAGSTRTRNSAMVALFTMCNAGLSLACMGLERTLRHHCSFDGNKSLTCAGPQADHQSGSATGYCEGEPHSGAGQDFVGEAANASVPVIAAAAARWAEVCKQPDDPCDQEQCTNWCRRIAPKTPDEAMAGRDGSRQGYCFNHLPDSSCVMHECACGDSTSCGGRGQPCCTSGQTCRSADDECGAATRTCVPRGEGSCTARDLDGGLTVSDAGVGGSAPGASCRDAAPGDATCLAAESVDLDGEVAHDDASREGDVVRQDPWPDVPPISSGASGMCDADPHLRTFDGARYDCQAKGELTLVVSTLGDLEVQIRTQPFAGQNVSVMTAVAAAVGADTLAFYLDRGPTLNHVPTTFATGRTSLAGGGAVWKVRNDYVVIWPDNSQLRIRNSAAFLGAEVFLSPARSGLVAGLLGNANGTTDDDLVSRGGALTLTTPVPFAAFYGRYVESWRVTQASSLFDYAPAESTALFTDRSFPSQPATLRDLTASQVEAATTICQQAGVPSAWLDACILDVGLSGGDVRFARSLATAPAVTTSLELEPLRSQSDAGCPPPAPRTSSIGCQGGWLSGAGGGGIQGSTCLHGTPYGTSDYAVFVVDTRGLTGTTLDIALQLNNGASSASFDLYRECQVLPTGSSRPSIAGAYDVPPGVLRHLVVPFVPGEIFQLGIEGNWFSPPTSQNTVDFTISSR